MAHYLRLSSKDNVVTVATDGFDRYLSVMEDLERRYLETHDSVLRRWAKDIFHDEKTEQVLDFRGVEAKEQLYHQKEKDWLPFGYNLAYLDEMKTQEFWEREYAKTKEYDQKILRLR